MWANSEFIGENSECDPRIRESSPEERELGQSPF